MKRALATAWQSASHATGARVAVRCAGAASTHDFLRVQRHDDRVGSGEARRLAPMGSAADVDHVTRAPVPNTARRSAADLTRRSRWTEVRFMLLSLQLQPLLRLQF
jgi:hypothetical protein